jgi:hypothetical protein
LGIGDWGLGIGDWAQSPIPNPQSPIPNPHSIFLKFKIINNKYTYSCKLINKNKFKL